MQPNLQRLQNMAYNKYDKLEWTLIFVSEFGKRFGLSLKQAFNYLSRYQGIAFVDSHYDYVHTQSSTIWRSIAIKTEEHLYDSISRH